LGRLKPTAFFMPQNAEIKAYCRNPSVIKDWLQKHGADFKGTDLQTDTYFNVQKGRLKLREGTIERALIWYERENAAAPKLSKVELMHVAENSIHLKTILTQSLGVKVIVQKKREIWFIDNVKFHIDDVEGLGSFVEIEAIDSNGQLGFDYIHRQCSEYMEYFQIKDTDLLTHSYSDLLLK
jgi:adenylate cyclase, class 2